MGRAGAFSANFDPDTLDEFRSFCSSRGEKYTKVLEQLAVLYLNSSGEVLSGATGVSVPPPRTLGAQQTTTNTTSPVDEDLMRRLRRLEENDEFNSETFETIFKRLEDVEKVAKTGRYRK